MRRFSKTLGENGLGQVLDIVPNHMAIGSQNRFWWDVLENGAASRYASFFDIDWNPQEERLRDKVLVPILGGPVWAGAGEGRHYGHRGKVREVCGGGGGADAAGSTDVVAGNSWRRLRYMRGRMR